jgi:hypothetical protein
MRVRYSWVQVYNEASLLVLNSRRGLHNCPIHRRCPTGAPQGGRVVGHVCTCACVCVCVCVCVFVLCMCVYVLCVCVCGCCCVAVVRPFGRIPQGDIV